MKTAIEVIDLAYAKQLLEQNPQNRRLSEALVQKYAQEMKRGRWEVNGEPIIIDEQGNLLDGQHRCAAIILSQMPLSTVVVRDVPRERFKTIDIGRSRKLVDVLLISGYKNVSKLAAGARWLYNYIANVPVNTTTSVPELYEFINENRIILEKCTNIVVSGSTFIFPTGPLIGVGAIANINNDDKYMDEFISFVDGIRYGENLYRGDARLTMRNWLLSPALNSVRRVSVNTFVAYVRAWNAYASGNTLEMIKVLTDKTIKRENLVVYGYVHKDDMKQQKTNN